MKLNSYCVYNFRYLIYNLGVIRDEIEFRRDIENAKEGTKVLVVKH